MSNSSGFSGFPPKITGADGFPPSRAELKAKIVAIRGEARVQRAREKMEGEVIRHNRNGTTDIKTSRGEITVELSPKERPAEGAQIILDVPKGEPPRHVTISRAPREVSQGETRQGRAETTQQTPRETSRGEGAKITPETSLSISRQTTEESRPPQNAPSVPPLREGDFLRLTPLPQYESVQPLQQTVRAAIETIAARVEIVAFQAVQNTSSPPLAQTSQTSLQATRPLLQSAAVFATSITSALPNDSSALLGNAALSSQAARTQIQPPLQAVTEFLGFPLSQLKTALTNLSVTTQSAAGQTALIAPVAEALQTLPPVTALQSFTPAAQNIVQDIIQAAATPQKASQKVQDVKINTIFPPPVALSAIETAAAGKISDFEPATIKQTSTSSVMQGGKAIETLLTTQNIMASKAVVTGQSALSQPVLSVFMPQTQSWQNFTIPVQPQNLSVGTQMEVLPHIMQAQPNMAAAATPQAAVLPPFIPFEFFSGASWPAAEDIVQTMQQAMPQAAQMLGQATPNAAAPTRLPAAALLFVAAVRGGDISGWLGDKNVDLLKRLGKSDALNRMTRDMGGLQRTASEPVSQDWRGMALPMVYDGELSKMMLYYRHDKQENEDGETRRGTRFIFDLNLSKMGAVQIDGLHRPINDKQGKMDLVVRTTKPISENMRKTMRAVYLDALQQAEAIGDISFQSEEKKFIKVDMPKSSVSL